MIPDCAYVGDSIAVGLQQLDRECAVYAKVGASTDYIAKTYSGAQGAIYTVISMGSNLPNNPNNLENAIKLRKSIDGQIIWILPYNRVAANTIKQVAKKFGDSYIDLSPIPTKDHVHPNYKQINRKINQYLKVMFD